MQCVICQNNKIKKIFFKDNFSFYECVKCHHVFVDPMPTNTALKAFYSLEYFKAGLSKGYQHGYESIGEQQKNNLKKSESPLSSTRRRPFRMLS